MRVAYLGPAGTYTDEAMRSSATGRIDPQPRSTVYEAVMAVQEGEADRGVVPIENSLEGAGGRGGARGDRPRQDLDRLLGLQRRVARRAGVGPGRALRPVAQPHQDRVPPASGRARPLHVLRRPRGSRARPERGRGAGGTV